MLHCAAGCIARSPGFPRTGVRSMPIRTQCASVDPRIGNGVEDLLTRAAKQPGCNRARSDSNQQHMVEADTIKRVLECEDSLNFVRLDHRRKQVTNCVRLLLLRDISATDEI